MSSTRDPAADQLANYKAANPSPKELTTDNGVCVGGMTNSVTAGERGPLLVQDVQFFNEIATFARERIPERVVHAKGAGAFGYFEVTHDITKYCKAKVFEKIGKRTPIAIRFSTVAGEKGSSDTVRDPRGFAVKLYTDEGNWDLTGNNTPIFFIRDPILFPSFIHSQKRNPVTNLKDPDMFWDFATLRHETAHQMSFVHSDRGIPDGFRHMNGYGSHTFKLVNAAGKPIYCKFHYKTDQGIKNMPVEKAAQLASSDPDYATRDLFNAIANGNYPKWTLYIQVMTFEQAERFQWNPFDMTKIWPHGQYPLIPIGKLVLDRNPVNYFAEVEQIAFSPSNMVPGIEPSPDKMLQGRLFSYDDTHRYRLGANFMQIPVNCPYRTRTKNYHRDGLMCVNNSQEGAPNYYPNSFGGPVENEKCLDSKWTVSGDVARHKTDGDDNYSQVATFWNKVLKADERERLAENIGCHACNAQDFLQERVVSMFTKVDPEYGAAVRKAINKYKTMKGPMHHL